MTDEAKFKLGDIVVVKGSPDQKMAVKNLRILDETADLIWIDAMGSLQKETLPFWVLEKVGPEPK